MKWEHIEIVEPSKGDLRIKKRFAWLTPVTTDWIKPTYTVYLSKFYKMQVYTKGYGQRGKWVTRYMFVDEQIPKLIERLENLSKDRGIGMSDRESYKAQLEFVQKLLNDNFQDQVKNVING